MIRIIPFYLWAIAFIASLLYYNNLYIGAYKRLKLRDDRFDSFSNLLRKFIRPSLIQDDYTHDREFASTHFENESKRGFAPFLATVVTLLAFPGRLFQINIWSPNIYLSLFAILSLFCVIAAWWLFIYFATCQGSKIKLRDPTVIRRGVQALFITGYIHVVQTWLA